jgi:hypothetical protein
MMKITVINCSMNNTYHNKRRFSAYLMKPEVFLINKLFNKGSYKYNPGNHEHNWKGIRDTGEKAEKQNQRNQKTSETELKATLANCNTQRMHSRLH